MCVVMLPFPMYSQVVVRGTEQHKVFNESIWQTTKNNLNYDAFVQKQNIVWLADEITISQPLRSFGGTIVLAANVININQSVDSRVYIRRQIKCPAPGKCIAPYQPSPNQIPSIDAQLHTAHGVHYREMLEDYYTKCFDCYLDVNSDSVYIPELPSGRTPDSGSWWGYPPRIVSVAEAPNAESLNPQNDRAGDIYIFAHEINFSPDLASPVVPIERDECVGASTRTVPYAVNAGGARGGRGGSGMPSPVIDGDSFGAAWVSMHPGNGIDTGQAMQVPGGDSAPGGPGGDAGRIFIRYVNATSVPTLADLKNYLNYAGGSSGDVTRVQTPSVWRVVISQELPPNRCSMPVTGNYPPSEKGQDALPPEVIGVDTTYALTDLSSLLKHFDQRIDYDYNELATRANSDYSIKSLDFADSLTELLASSLVSAEISLVQTIDKAATTGVAPDNSPLLPPLARTIDVQRLGNSDLTDTQLVFARELTNFKNDGVDNSVYQYLEVTGGLLNIMNWDPYSRYTSGATRIDISTGNKILSDSLNRLNKINETLFEHLTFVKSQQLEKNISDAKADIAKAMQKAAAAKANTQDPSILKILASVIGELTGAGDALTLIENLFGNQLDNAQGGSSCKKDQTLCDLKNLGSALSEADTAFRKLNDLLSSPGATSTPDLVDLQAKLIEAEQDYRSFMQQAQVQRDQLFQQRYADFLQALALRSSLNSKIAADSAQFDDLLRITVLGDVADSSANELDLRSNLKGIVTFLSGFPAEEPYFKIRQLNGACDRLTQKTWVRRLVFKRETNPCLELPKSGDWRLVTSAVHLGNVSLSLPIYVIAPTDKELSLPVFGSSMSITKIDKPTLKLEIRRPIITGRPESAF
jgi:hypothetical protein